MIEFIFGNVVGTLLLASLYLAYLYYEQYSRKRNYKNLIRHKMKILQQLRDTSEEKEPEQEIQEPKFPFNLIQQNMEVKNNEMAEPSYSVNVASYDTRSVIR